MCSTRTRTSKDPELCLLGKGIVPSHTWFRFLAEVTDFRGRLL